MAAAITANGLRKTYGHLTAVKGRAFGSPLARGLYPRASTAEVDPRASPGPRPLWTARSMSVSAAAR
jgi:hypothetical protein